MNYCGMATSILSILKRVPVPALVTPLRTHSISFTVHMKGVYKLKAIRIASKFTKAVKVLIH